MIDGSHMPTRIEVCGKRKKKKNKKEEKNNIGEKIMPSKNG